MKNLNASVDFIKSDLFENVSGKYNFILSNPPYIKSENLNSLQSEVKYEPKLALDGGVDGLDFYRIIALNAHKFLKANGFLIAELGINQSTKVKGLF